MVGMVNMLVCLIVFFCFITPVVSQELDRNVWVGVSKNIRHSVVKIYVVGQRGNMPGQRLEYGGTGFLISDARVITNHHVIAYAADITVELNDGRKFLAIQLGNDAEIDLAILKIQHSENPSLPPPVRLGDSSTLEVGMFVAAIGNALNLGISMTMGIVSAIGPVNPDITSIDLIQTDTALNSGNSGGPLVNLNSEVIGVNTAIMAGIGISGIGFAIPINYVKDTLEQFDQGQHLAHGWIGVQVTRALDEDYELWHIPPETSGVIITKIIPQSPAEKSGLKISDFITHIDQQVVRSQRHFAWLIRNKKGLLTLTLFRSGTLMHISVEAIENAKSVAQKNPPSLIMPPKN